MKWVREVAWKLQWWAERRRRKAEEFRLYSIALVTEEEDDRAAWRKLNAENHQLGVW